MFDSLWYDSLIKPPFAPPDWIFAPAWTILYLMILFAFCFYFLKQAENKKSGYVFFAVQMFLNLIWSPIFFHHKSIIFAFIVIILLDIFVFLTIKKFYEVSKISAILLIPYFTWVIYATYLNIGYLILN